MATRPNEMVNEAMARALLGMKQRYSIRAPAATDPRRAAAPQVTERIGILSKLSDGRPILLACRAYKALC
jgi:hypothetical protein